MFDFYFKLLLFKLSIQQIIQKKMLSSTTIFNINILEWFLSLKTRVMTATNFSFAITEIKC